MMTAAKIMCLKKNVSLSKNSSVQDLYQDLQESENCLDE